MGWGLEGFNRRIGFALPVAIARGKGPTPVFLQSSAARAATFARLAVPLLAVALLTVAITGPVFAQGFNAPPPPLPTESINRLAPQTLPQLSPAIAGPQIIGQTGPGAGQQISIGRVILPQGTGIPGGALRLTIEGIEGQTVPLSRIEEARLRILRLWREAGQPFASVTANLSPGPNGAELRYSVIEGYIAEVKLEGDIGPAGTQVLRFLEPLVNRRPLTGAAMERALLLASDVPGVSVRGVLQPVPGGAGALRLVAQVERRAFTGYVTADNRAYDLTGPVQGLAAFSANSFSSLGERTELSFYQSEGSTQWFTQATGEFFVGASGTRIRLYAGTGVATPGSSLAAIGYAGDTRIFGGSIAYPVIRSRPRNLNIVGYLDAFESEVTTGFGDTQGRASYDSVRAARIGLDGSQLDRWIPFLPLASNVASVRFSQGLSGFGATDNDSQTLSRAGADFTFTKVNGEVLRNQPLFTIAEQAVVSFQGLISAQYTPDVLPPSEKFYFGGNRLGRGFYAGEVTGDSAAGYSLELQLDRRFEQPETPWGIVALATQFYIFRDYGRAFNNNADPNQRVSSYGGGIRTILNDTVQLDLEAVERITRNYGAPGSNTPPLAAQAYYMRLLVRF